MLRLVLVVAGVIAGVWLGAVQLASSAAYGDLAARPSFPALLHDLDVHLLRGALGDGRARAAAELHDGDLAAAQAILQTLPDDAGAADLRGRLAQAQGRRDDAIVAYMRAGDVVRAQALIDALAAEDPARALADQRLLVARLGDNPAAGEVTGQAWWRLGQLQAAAGYRDPVHRPAYWRDAETSYERALALGPNEETYLLAAGFQSLANGDASASLRWYGRAAEVVPNSADAYGGLAWASAALGDCARARRELARARALYAATTTAEHRDPAEAPIVGTATGIGVYQRDLAAALRAAGTDVRPLSAPQLNPWRFDRRVLWDQLLLPLAAARSGATLLHASAGTMPLLRTLPTVVTVHDLAWHRVQAHTRGYARAYFGTLQARAYRSAAAVVCDSHFSANEYRELIEPRTVVDVVYPGVDERFARVVRRPDDSPFALVVGTVETRKNLLILIEALPALPTLRLVCVGPPTPYADEVRKRAAELNVADRVDLRGYVAQSEIDDLYARATCALIPSRYEGFGYALAEALCAGTPAIAAQTSSLIEVANGAVPLIPPDDATAWTEAIQALLANRGAAETTAASLRTTAATRFAWPTTATQMNTIYKRIALSH